MGNKATVIIGTGLGVATAIVLMGPALAASAPNFASADHSTSMSCTAQNFPTACRAQAAADGQRAILSVATAVDSGLGGTLPAAADSTAYADVSKTADIGKASAAAFTFHVHVTHDTSSQSGQGKSWIILSAQATCDRCVNAQQDAYPDGIGTESITVTLPRAANGGSTARVSFTAYSDSNVSCDDVCVLAPGGMASAAATVQVTGIDVTLFGLGKPAVPAITQPTSGSTLRATAASQAYGAAVYNQVCNPQCPSGGGELFVGTADPGMPVHVVEGSHVLASTQTAGDGEWAVLLQLPNGHHRITAVATGTGGSSISSPVAISVTG
jgi:hypothetical protein